MSDLRILGAAVWQLLTIWWPLVPLILGAALWEVKYGPHTRPS